MKMAQKSVHVYEKVSHAYIAIFKTIMAGTLELYMYIILY